MSDAKQMIKQDMINILKYSARYEMALPEDSKEVLRLVGADEGTMTSSIGRLYTDRLWEMVVGADPAEKTCLFCKTNPTEDGILCADCMKRYSGGRLIFYKKPVEEPVEDQVVPSIDAPVESEPEIREEPVVPEEAPAEEGAPALEFVEEAPAEPEAEIPVTETESAPEPEVTEEPVALEAEPEPEPEPELEVAEEPVALEAEPEAVPEIREEEPVVIEQEPEDDISEEKPEPIAETDAVSEQEPVPEVQEEEQEIAEPEIKEEEPVPSEEEAPVALEFTEPEATEEPVALEAEPEAAPEVTEEPVALEAEPEIEPESETEAPVPEPEPMPAIKKPEPATTEDFGYCQECGAKLQYDVCIVCGTPKGEGSNYCGCCGAKRRREEPEEIPAPVKEETPEETLEKAPDKEPEKKSEPKQEQQSSLVADLEAEQNYQAEIIKELTSRNEKPKKAFEFKKRYIIIAVVVLGLIIGIVHGLAGKGGSGSGTGKAVTESSSGSPEDRYAERCKEEYSAYITEVSKGKTNFTVGLTFDEEMDFDKGKYNKYTITFEGEEEGNLYVHSDGKEVTDVLAVTGKGGDAATVLQVAAAKAADPGLTSNDALSTVYAAMNKFNEDMENGGTEVSKEKKNGYSYTFATADGIITLSIEKE